ncbi:DeoR/GlpR family DNA-binding transcription regulator [Kibdelosporangium philippinense]|uniref:DeoR/GlpR family DNA-binding transcription regulator n=1 Tax=Kibdelosporangium philippinense TaxID=211113 RepID=A0ABS8Z868_9PSEU|nr:DeoR/GlpR family DNA-binding transcription regulator [Kibdelosporangium philippinense]MCE7004073.1 DeoR/GlpR family DNA-binding transcription regulator [Kibdelosporangium philippinense]
MASHERWNALLEIIARDGRLEVETAAHELDVSTATIRRDLDRLAQQQMVTRTRGGATANNVSYDLPLRYKTARHATEKDRIARAASALIRPGGVVGLNGGTTTTEVARALATRADLLAAGGDAALTVVTNALNIANELTVRQHVKIVVTGGVVRPQSYELTGPLGTLVLEQLTLDHLFLGVDAISATEGATAYNEGEASINQLMVARARQVIVVADSSKLGRHAFARICEIRQVNVLITDSGAEPAAVAAFADAGVQVIRA